MCFMDKSDPALQIKFKLAHLSYVIQVLGPHNSLNLTTVRPFCLKTLGTGRTQGQLCERGHCLREPRWPTVSEGLVFLLGGNLSPRHFLHSVKQQLSSHTFQTLRKKFEISLWCISVLACPGPVKSWVVHFDQYLKVTGVFFPTGSLYM